MSKEILAIFAMALCIGLFASAPADAAEGCGGQYPFAVEVQDVELPDGAPVMSVSYCSDGTLEPVLPPTQDEVSGCGGGEYPVTVEAGPLEGTSYCSDGTLDALSDPEGAVETLIGLIEGELP